MFHLKKKIKHLLYCKAHEASTLDKLNIIKFKNSDFEEINTALTTGINFAVHFRTNL